MMENQLLADYIDIYMNGIKYAEQLVSKPTQEYGISFEQFLILNDLNSLGQMTLKELTNRRKVTRGAISRQLRVLHKKHFITQVKDENDLRKTNINLTALGENVVNKLNPIINERFSNWIKMFGPERSKEMLELMREFIQRVMTSELS